MRSAAGMLSARTNVPTWAFRRLGSQRSEIPENPRSTFGWSRIWARDDTGEAGRGASFWIERGKGRVKIDRTLVLVAGQRLGD